MKPEFVLNKDLRFIPKDPESLRLHIEGLKRDLERAQDLNKQVSLLGDIGVYLRSLDLFDEAESSIKKALQLIAENKMGISKEIQNKIRLAHVYQEKMDFKLSSSLFDEIIKTCRTSSEAESYLHFALQHAGKNCFDQGQYQKARDFFEETLKIRKAISAPQDQLESTQMALDRVCELMEGRNMTSKEIPTIKTDRLTLRPFKLSDAKEVQRQAGNPKVAATTATIPYPYPDGAAEDWISKHQEWFEKGLAVDWAIELNESNFLIGCISLGVSKTHQRAEVGYWIGEENWSKGYCSEAAKAAFKYAFEEMKLNKITSRHMLENPASGKVMQNAGMEQEGILRQDFCKNGRFVDMVVYGLLKDQWVKM